MKSLLMQDYLLETKLKTNKNNNDSIHIYMFIYNKTNIERKTF